MILTVTLNAAIDRTVAVPNFRLGQRHRAVEARTVAGGKGVNVARVAQALRARARQLASRESSVWARSRRRWSPDSRIASATAVFASAFV